MSQPVEFETNSLLKSTAKLRLFRDNLVCILYSEVTGEDITYNFLKDGISIQMSSSPFFNVLGPIDPAGTYEVEVKAGRFVTTSD